MRILLAPINPHRQSLGLIKMQDSWYILHPELLSEIEEIIKKEYPTLEVTTDADVVCIKGVLQITDTEKSTLIDRYSIEIEFPDDFPKSIPFVKEVGDRIPKTIDRHFNPNHTACLFIPEERDKYYPEGASIRDFIEKCVKPFFINQSYYEEKETWLSGERPHGLDGVINYYQESYGENSKDVIKQFMEYLAKKEIKGHWLCYCGSGDKLRKCHMKYLIYYRSLYHEQAVKFMQNLLSNKI